MYEHEVRQIRSLLQRMERWRVRTERHLQARVARWPHVHPLHRALVSLWLVLWILATLNVGRHVLLVQLGPVELNAVGLIGLTGSVLHLLAILTRATKRRRRRKADAG